MDIRLADSWRAVHAGRRVAVLALGNLENPARHAALDARCRALEAALRARFAGQGRADLAALDTIRAYTAFYKPFNKSYHVLLQLESVALRGKALASPSALVQAMFMAELESQLLTAGHDLDRVVAPVTITASRGDETYTRINGQPQTLKAGDMTMVDAEGVLSSVLYGPDARTALGASTRRAMYVTYAPAAIGAAALEAHLDCLDAYVRLVAPAAVLEVRGVWGGA